MSRTKRNSRIPGRKVVLGLSGLIGGVVLTASAVFLLNREPRGPIYWMAATDDADALVLRHGFAQRDTVHLALYDARGEHQWSSAVYGATSTTVPELAGAYVMVTARTADKRPSTFVYRVADGTLAFRADPPPASVADDALPTWLVQGERLYELFAGRPGNLASYELPTGKLIARIDAPEGAVGLGLGADGETLVIETAGAPVAFEPERLTRLEGEALEPTREAASSKLVARADCISWDSAELPRSALPAGTLTSLPGLVRIDGADGAVTLALPEGNALRVAAIEADDEAIAPTEPDHVGATHVFVHTERDILGLPLATLASPADYDGDFSVTTRALAAGSCAAR